METDARIRKHIATHRKSAHDASINLQMVEQRLQSRAISSIVLIFAVGFRLAESAQIGTTLGNLPQSRSELIAHIDLSKGSRADISTRSFTTSI
jgi:hypothetical protein